MLILKRSARLGGIVVVVKPVGEELEGESMPVGGLAGVVLLDVRTILLVNKKYKIKNVQ
ncbi:MAG: hypothetical protein JW891_07110 [Candidatus Lokiarchaeota archaeon]|nr:hypothetical protein [Candidatus Lokiarchaeota archaeon]